MGARTFTPHSEAFESVPAPDEGPVVRPVIRPGRAREAAALCLFALAAFLVLSLGTYAKSIGDPSVRGENWTGPAGEFLAGILVQGFGIAAWLVPVELSLIGAPLFRGKELGPVGLRLAGDLVVAVIVAALVQVAVPDATAFGNMPGAGNVGLLFGELMRGLFSTVGSFLVGGTLIGLILIGRSTFSFIAWIQRVASLARGLAWRVASTARRVALAWRQARSLRKEQTGLSHELRIETRGTDEAIIAQLEEDEADWPSLDTTDSPPLAMATSLREVDVGLEEEADAEADATPTPVTRVEPKRADAAASDLPEETPARGLAAATQADLRPRKRKRLPEEPGPKIVDCCPAAKVARRAATVETRRGAYRCPPPDLLSAPDQETLGVDKDRILEHARRLEKTLSDYGVRGTVEEVHPGPTVTTFEVAPEAGTKVSRVANLSDDLALGLSRKVRIVAPIPGKGRIGFELPNDVRVPVNLRELIEDQRFAKLAEKAPLPVVLGRDIVGAPFYADLASMPHVIVAGATGSGKSVGLNVMMASLLFCRSPDDMRLLMIDPKVVELAPFDGIPHMLLPVVTDMKQAAVALRWAVDEMERRYQLFATAGTKNIVTYNRWVGRVISGDLPAPDPDQVEALGADGSVVVVPPSQEGSDGTRLPGKLPYIVVVVEEFADLMMQQGKEVEASVARLAQKARAAGMHVVLATQRPSVDVITGMIKANFPSRVAYRVAQRVDSRTILDEQGAEVLLGKGDMLVKTNGATETRRVQCPFISEEEVGMLTDYLRQQGSPKYHEAILLAADETPDEQDEGEKLDPRFDEAVRIVADTQRCSTSWLQRKMTVGYNRAAKIVEMMEKRGMVGPSNGARDREVLIHPQ